MWMRGVPSPGDLSLLTLPTKSLWNSPIPPKNNHTHIENKTNPKHKTASLTCLSPGGGQGLFGISILTGGQPWWIITPQKHAERAEDAGLCLCEISTSFHMDHSFQVRPKIKQHNNKDNRRPTSSPNKDVIQLPAHTCWNLHSLITWKLLQPAVGPGITPFGDSDKQPSSLGEGHHRIASLPDGFQRPGCHPSHSLQLEWPLFWPISLCLYESRPWQFAYKKWMW